MAVADNPLKQQAQSVIAKRSREREQRQSKKDAVLKPPPGGWLYKLYGRQVDAFEAVDSHNHRQLGIPAHDRSWARVVSVETNASGEIKSVESLQNAVNPSSSKHLRCLAAISLFQ